MSIGMAIGMGGATGTGKITVKNPDGSRAATISISAPSKKKTKRLRYNFKEISGQILRAKTCMSAKQVMVRARGKVAILRRQVQCGEYDDTELSHAIMHAEQMARIAKKRMKHLEEEERARKHDSETMCEAELDEKNERRYPDLPEDIELDSEKIKELMQELKALQDEMEQSDLLEGGSDLILGGDMDPGDLELLKKKHRASELREITEADMKYLRAFFTQLEKDRRAAASGVSLELSGVKMPVPIPGTAASAAAASVQEPIITEGGSIDIMA